MTKIGIFGGRFDPPHSGHLNLAREAMKELKLKKMLIIPTKKSPHKDEANGGAPFQKRIEMCRLTFPESEGFEVSGIEGELHGVSYTINTLRALRETYPKDTQFYLLIGGDMLFCFEKWYRYESILKECKVVAVARHNDECISMMEYANEIGRVKVLNIPVIDISSTEIREKVKLGQDASEYLNEELRSYIETNSLYR